MNEKPDIFDRIFSARALRFFLPVYTRYKKPLLYMFFGALTTLISIGTFDLFTRVIPWDALAANVIAWLASVFFAFITSRKWVFVEAARGSFGRQMFNFYLGRAMTLLLEELILLVFVTWLKCNPLVIKLICQVVIVTLNYIISKLFVFKTSR